MNAFHSNNRNQSGQPKSKRINILFVIPSLHAGGSERVVLHLVRHLSRDLFNITLLVLKKEGAFLALIPSDIKVINFDYSRTIHSIFAILRLIWQLRPNIVFSTLGHLNLIIALLKPFLPRETLLVARESSIISFRNKDERYPKIFNFLFKTVYKRLHCIICQSEYMKNDLVVNFSVPQHLIKVINNPVDFSMMPQSLQTRNDRSNDCNLISIGQLRKEKGYERILRSLSKSQINFNYKIIGGGDKENLQRLIDALHLTHKVTLLGSLAYPYHELAKSDCLILGSFYEGFPNVVLEANACGIPVIAFKAPGGHNEIIIDGVNGWFVNSEEELNSLLALKVYQRVDKVKIIELTNKRYNIEKIVRQYEEAFIICHGKPAKR